MKYTAIAFGIIVICIYLSPLYKSKLNLGNIFGIALGTLIICVSLYFEQIKLFYNTGFGKVFLIIFVVLFTVIMTAFSITMCKIIKHSKYVPVTANTVIVLGCRVKGTVASKALKKRCEAASNYMKQNTNAVAILSGGQGADEYISEAECMYRLMIANGIAKDRLIKEAKSTSTYENLLYSKKIIDNRAMAKSVAVATSEYHLYRALLYAESLDIKASSIPAKSIPILRVPYFTREVFGIWWMKIKKVLHRN